MNKQQPLLQINNLSLAYGAKEILKAVHLTVCPGEILGIVGSSGGGKSTLLKTLTPAFYLLTLSLPAARSSGRGTACSSAAV